MTTPGASATTAAYSASSFFTHSTATDTDGATWASHCTYTTCEFTEYNTGTGACTTSTSGIRPSLSGSGSSYTMSLDATTALEDYVCFSCQIAKTSAWITNGWILFRVSDSSDCNWFLQTSTVSSTSYEVVASGTGSITYFTDGDGYSSVASSPPAGCTRHAYTMYDASGYTYSGSSLILGGSTGELLIYRNAIYSFWLRIRVTTSDGLYFKNTNWFQVSVACGTSSLTITVPSSLTSNILNFPISGNQPIFTFSDFDASNTNCPITNYYHYAAVNSASQTTNLVSAVSTSGTTHSVKVKWA